MKTIFVEGKEYKVIKRYKHFRLCEDKYGIKTCFSDFDLGLVKKMYKEEAKKITSNQPNTLLNLNKKMSQISFSWE